MKNSGIITLLIISLFALSYTLPDKVQKGYTAQEIRELYGSGHQELWPKPHLFDEAKENFKDISALPKPDFPKDNPYSKEKEELGKLLFFDPRLSKSGQISCANCHNPEIAWTDGNRVSFGHDRKQGNRNAPTILNIAFAKSLFWDGRAASIEDQVKGPIENPVEMNLHYKHAVKRIAKIKGYQSFFEKAFGDAKVNEDRINKAIATFERTLISPKSKFDKFVDGKKDELEVDAGGKALLCAEQDAILTVPQYIPQSTPLGEGDGGARHHKEGAVRKVFTDGGGVTVQHRCMPHANGYNFFRPSGKGFHNGHLLERRLAFVFLHAVRGGADA
jgi:hypothetical protein